MRPAARIQLAGDSVPRGRSHRRLIMGLAWREIRSHKVRSLLIVVLVAVPVALISSLGVLFAASDGNTEQAVASEFGHADLIVEPLAGWDGRCHQASLSQPFCPGLGGSVVGEVDERQREALENLTIPGLTLYPHRYGQAHIRWRGMTLTGAVTGIDLRSMPPRRVVPPEGPLPARDEVWLDAASAKRFGWRPGTRLTIDGALYEVTGLVRSASGDDPEIWTAPDSPLVSSGALTYYGAGQVPTDRQLAQLNEKGLAVVTRAAAAQGYSGTDAQDLVLFGYIVGLGTLAALVTATVAGAAFAIGARQQRRMLALLGVTGASRRDLFGVVHRQGLLLGGAGSVLGVVLGTGGANLVVALLNATSTSYPFPHALGLRYSLAGLVVGLTASSVASWLPARAIVNQDALVGVRRAESASPPVCCPWLGIVLGAIGVVVGALGTWRFRTHFEPQVTEGQEQLFIPLTCCIVLMYLGCLAALPWILAKVAARGHSRLSVRLALRDLDRARCRSVGCVAASLAVMTLFTAVVTGLAGEDRAVVQNYRPALPPQTAVLAGRDGTYQSVPSAVMERELSVVRRVLGTRTRALTSQNLSTGNFEEWPTTVNVSYTAGVGSPSHREVPVAVDDGALYQHITGIRPGPRIRKALEEGVVVLDPTHAHPAGDGSLAATMVYDSSSEQQRQVEVPAVLAEGNHHGRDLPVLMSMGSARKHLRDPYQRLGTEQGPTFLVTPGQPTADQARRINSEISGLTGAHTDFTHETGPDRFSRSLMRLAVGIGAGVMLAVGTVVLALTLSDSRVSRSSLAAVGASPRTMRRAAAVHALVTTLIGQLGGLLVGLTPVALGTWAARLHTCVTVPVGWLLLLALGVPVVLAVAVRFAPPVAVPLPRRRS